MEQESKLFRTVWLELCHSAETPKDDLAVTQQPKDVLMPARRMFPPPPPDYQGAPEKPQPQLQPQQQLLQQYETPHQPLPRTGDRQQEMEAPIKRETLPYFKNHQVENKYE
uniref:Uncharacterized protein n=1 Tax=Romanomermis culicivorax TaxID=13658 RepID=A0A915JXX4_ROMCU